MYICEYCSVLRSLVCFATCTLVKNLLPFRIIYHWVFFFLPATGNQANFSKSSDAFAFEEDSSNDGLSPEQIRSEDSQGSTESAAGIKISEATLPTMSGTTQVKRYFLLLDRWDVLILWIKFAEPSHTHLPQAQSRSENMRLDSAQWVCFQISPSAINFLRLSSPPVSIQYWTMSTRASIRKKCLMPEEAYSSPRGWNKNSLWVKRCNACQDLSEGTVAYGGSQL